MSKNVSCRVLGKVFDVAINRPASRNAVDRATAASLKAAFQQFDADENLSVAVLRGEGAHFCAGADLMAMIGESKDGGEINDVSDLGPMGPTALHLSKPVIAAIEGFAVAGGLELACWCDLRVVAESAKFGVFCRRRGVPLIDGGTVRLPRLIGQSHAMDMILTGREVAAEEAKAIGLANRVVPEGQAAAAAIKLAEELSKFPQTCLRNDRLSALQQWSMPHDAAMRQEFNLGIKTLESDEFMKGAQAFAQERRHKKGASSTSKL